MSQDQQNLNKLKLFYLGARPRTLPAAVSPVIVGSAIAVNRRLGDLSIAKFILCLAVALFLQIGVNYANDYSDGIKGTDDKRVGPLRLVGSNLVEPRYVKYAAFICGLLAAVAGLILALVTSFWFIPVGLVSILAAWGYTGGPKPYGYMALGELSVLIFFGFVATVGSFYAQSLHINSVSVVGGLSVGLLACSILVANNLRDIEGDRQNRKRTLAVLLGDTYTRFLLVFTTVMGIILSIAIGYMLHDMWTSIAVATLAVAVNPLIRTIRKAKGKDLIPVLKQVAMIEIVYSILLTIGLFVR